MDRVHYRRVMEPGMRRRSSDMAIDDVTDYRERLLLQGVVCAAMLAVVLTVRLIDTDLTVRIRTNLFYALSEQVSTEKIAVGFRQIKEMLPGQNGSGGTTSGATGGTTGGATGNSGINSGINIGGNTENGGAESAVGASGQNAAINSGEAMLPVTNAANAANTANTANTANATNAPNAANSGANSTVNSAANFADTTATVPADMYIDEDVLAELDVSKLTVPELPVSPEP